MINGIKPIVGNTTKTEKTTTKNGLSFDEAMDNLLLTIQVAYDNWSNNGKTLDLSLKPGRKFIKVIRDNSVWGFIAKKDGEHKGLPMKSGDVFKPAGWASAAKHTRGNIFDDNQDYFQWTGPNYL